MEPAFTLIYCILLLVQIATNLIQSTSLPNDDQAIRANFLKPVIRHTPVDTFSSEGVLEFTCQADGNPKPIINWYNADTKEKVVDQMPNSGSTPGIHVNQHYGKLMISNPTLKKVYSFYCNASNSVGWTISSPPVQGGLAFLQTKFRRVPMGLTAFEGDQVILECRAPVGLPEPKIIWRFGDKLITDRIESRRAHHDYHISEQGDFQIKSVSRSDSGTYYCEASNVAGRRQSPPAHLVVKPRVKFIETPANIRVKKGESAKFKCRTEGNQIVQWRRAHGEGMIDSTRTELTESYLLLKDVELSDAGVYICTGAGSISAEAILTVETPPSFLKTPDDVSVRKGEVAVFDCVSTGFPKPSIYWELPDKTPIFPQDASSFDDPNAKYKLHKNGRLEIRRVTESDSGRYQCTAHSSIDRTYSSAMLKIAPVSHKGQYTNSRSDSSIENKDAAISFSLPDHIYHLFPIIGLPPANQTGVIGDVITLDCELGASRQPINPNMNSVPLLTHENAFKSYTVPEWSVVWQRATLGTGNKWKLIEFSGYSDEQRYSLLPGGSMQIYDAQLSDSGRYTCTAHTLFKWHQENVLQQTNWTATLQVVHRHVASFSDPARENSLSPPRNLRLTNLTDTTVTLAWDAANWLEFMPENFVNFLSNNRDSQPEVTYWVEYYRPDHLDEGWITVENNWPANTVQIGGLQPNSPYYFLIRPRWNNGRLGWASAPLGPVIMFKPSHPEPNLLSKSEKLSDGLALNAVHSVEITNLNLFPLSPTHVRASWSTIGEPSALGSLTGYTVLYRVISLMRCISINSVNSDITVDTMTHADAANAYCSLKSHTHAFAGNQQNVLFRLQEFQALLDRITAQSISPFIHSDVKVKFADSSPNFDRNYVLTHQQSALMRNLNAFRCYEVKIRPYAKAGLLGDVSGKESLSHTVLTYDTFPNAAPEQASGLWISDNELKLSWKPPPVTHWNGLLTGFVIYVYNEGTNDHKTVNVSSVSMDTVLRGFTGHIQYVIQIAAVNCKGIGVRNEPIRLSPDLMKKGLGVGWGYSRITGHSINDPDLSYTDQLMEQPWFIVLIVISFIASAVVIALLTFCCHRKRYIIQKSSAGALIANSSLYDGSATADSKSVPADSSISSTDVNRSSINRCRRGKGGLNLEPLLDSRAPQDADPSVTNTGTGYYLPPYLTDTSKPPYNGYSHVVSNNQMELNRINANGFLSCSRPNSVQPVVYTSKVPQSCATQNATDGTYDVANSLGTCDPHLTTNMIELPSNQLFPTQTTLLHYNHQQPPAYVTYRTAMLPQSQSIADITGPNGYCDRVINHALPLIAPVAQLNSSMNTSDRLTLSTADDLVTSTVTPYATASIIPNSVHNENKFKISLQHPLIRTGHMLATTDGLSDGPVHSEPSSYSSADSVGSSSFRNPTSLPVQQQGQIMNTIPNSCSTYYNGDPVEQLCSEVSHPIMTVSGSHRSKSGSGNCSNSTREEEVHYNARPMIADGMKPHTQLFIAEHERSRSETLPNFADGFIPPPPESPPPPAPRDPKLSSYIGDQFDKSDSVLSATERSSDSNQSDGCQLQWNGRDNKFMSNGFIRQSGGQDLYESTEEDSDIGDPRIPQPNAASTQISMSYPHSKLVTRLANSNAEPMPLCIPIPAEEVHGSTYARVY